MTARLDYFLHLAEPSPMRVVERYANGSGVVELTIFKVGTINLAKTATGTNASLDVTRDVLLDMSRNFYKVDRPVGVFTDRHGYDKGGAQIAFYEAVWVEDKHLRARVWCCAALLAEVEAGMWRGFSVEAAKDRENSSGPLPGWSLYGGVFTNNPGSNVNNRLEMEKIAASAVVEFDFKVEGDSGETPKEEVPKPESPPVRRPAQEVRMSEVTTISLAAHQEEVSKLQAAIATEKSSVASMNGRLSTAQEQIAQLTGETVRLADELKVAHAELASHRGSAQAKDLRVAALEKLNREQATTIATQAASIERVTAESDKAAIIALVHEAVDAKVPPALFSGHEEDPVGWMRSRFASLDAFKDHVKVLAGVGPKVPDSTTVKAGSDPSKRESDPNAKDTNDGGALVLTEDNLYDGVESESQAKARLDRFKKQQASK